MPDKIVRSLFRVMGVGAVFSIVLALGACTEKKQSSDMPTEPGSAVVSEQSSGGPHPEGRIIVPAVTRGKEEILLVYKHTEHGYLESNGFDTLVFRFSSLPGGWLTGAIVSGRMLDGERDLAAFHFSRAADEIYVTEDSYYDEEPASADPSVTIVPDGSGLVIKGRDFSRTLSLPGDGSLNVVSASGTVTERWVGMRDAPDSGSTISRSGEVTAKGIFSFPAASQAKYVERKTGDTEGAEDLTCSMWFDKEGSWRFRIEAVEPVCEGYASGLAEALSGGKALENLALIEAVLGMDASIRPVLALAAASGKTGK
ncbi:MAG: hypothetical protein WBH97_05900 [Rectinemataceae bacterium]